MDIIVTEIREGIYIYPDLADWVRGFDDDPDDPDFDALSYMEGDPDKVKWGKYDMYFMDVILNGTRYILTSDELDESVKTMLARFHSDEFKRFYRSLPNSWEAFNEADNAVAYRGGSGYFYHIWEYTDQTKPS